MAFRGFTRYVDFNPGGAEGQALAARLALFARERLQAAQQEGVASDLYLRAVNGRIGEREETVRVPGPIVYRFEWVHLATRRALEVLRANAPVYTGRYKESFFVMVDGREVPLSAIRIGNEVAISNDQPYARKIHVGSEGFRTYRGIFEKARQVLLTEFRGVIKANVVFQELEGGYILKGRPPPRGARHGHTVSTRRDRRAGQPLTYPTLYISSPVTGFDGAVAGTA